MEFEFRRELGGQAQLELSMGHEAIARFINDELGDNPSVTQLLEKLAQGEFNQIKPFTYEGREQTLVIADGEVVVRDHRLHQHEELDDPDLELYDAESEAFCGLADFEHLLRSWLEFLNGR